MTKMIRHRAMFLSDLHLGTKGCQAELLLDFLDCHTADTIYLVGDIIDGWRLRSRWFWPEAHQSVVVRLLEKAHDGARIIYIPGNHDAFARAYAGCVFGGIEIARSATHVTADGRRFHVTHGDEFDLVIQRVRWLAHAGDLAYELAFFCNTHLNRLRRHLGLSYWSLSAWAKLNVKRVVNFIGSFETALSDQAASGSFHGVICGHIHHATIRALKGITYVNTGDFVESCTAVVEHRDGGLEVVQWREIAARKKAPALEQPEDIAVPNYA